MNVQDLLSREIGAYEAHKQDLLRAAPGKYVLIKGGEVLGVFDTYAEAAGEGWQRLGNVAFLVKEITETETPRSCTPNVLEHICEESAIPSLTSPAVVRSSQ